MPLLSLLWLLLNAELFAGSSGLAHTLEDGTPQPPPK